MKSVPYLDQPCERCGSKRFVSKVWKEKVPTYSGGFIEVEYSQIDCTNKACQKAFMEKQADELDKRKKVQAEREKDTLARNAKKALDKAAAKS